MATQSKYAPERVGDWGDPAATQPQGYETDTMTMPDGVKLFYRRWQANPAAPTLVLLHGLGAHSGWFIDMGNELHTRGLTVYAVDHRGFGRSEGARGHVRNGGAYTRDIIAFLQAIHTHQPNSPLFILGHSMGGIFALHVATDVAIRAQPLLSGMVLMNPWIADQTKVSPGAVARLVFAGMLGSAQPFKAAGGTETMTTNPEAITMLNDDPHWVRAQSASFLYQITRMRLAVMARARQARLPALVIQCEQDLAVVPSATRRMFDALASSDKTWKTYANFAHDVEFEPERAILDDDIAQWIKAHSDASA
ncbi:MAG TPA: alpha/beta hydrolase [Ktedonobacterales bacterium]|nr:alpha/beta hydrolase [Ktedonobacterales bacterium]